MKKILPLLMLLVFLTGINDSIAQDQKDKKRIEKKVNVEDNDGEITVTITEIDGKKESTTVLTGEDAEKYLEGEHHSSNAFYFKEEMDGDENVIIMEMSGEDGHGYSWVTDGDMDIEIDLEMEELQAELEKLRDELDQIDKEEISERLDEIIKMKEELEMVKVIHMESIHEDMKDLHEHIDVQVEEEDGVMIITKTVGDTKTVKEIKMDGDNNNKKVVVVSKSGVNSEEDEIRKHAITDGFELTVYPTPNDGNFTVEVDLKTDETAIVSITDSSGKEVYQRSIKGVNEHKLDVQLKKPSAGMYVVSVVQGERKVKLKTIIE